MLVRPSGLQGRGAPPRKGAYRVRARAPVARHPAGVAFHRSGNAMSATLDADKRYLVHCAHKIGCLLRVGNLPHVAGADVHANVLLLECIHVVFT